MGNTDFEKARDRYRKLYFGFMDTSSDDVFCFDTLEEVFNEGAKYAKDYFENEGKTELLENEMGKILDVLKEKNNAISELLIALENMVAQCCEFDEVYEDAKATCGKYSGRLTGKHDF